MKKQLATLLLTFIFCFTTVIPGFAADSAVPMADKIGAMEKMLYGTEQSGSLLQRMDSLEDDVYGTITSDAIINRVDNMYDYLEGTPDNGEASFATKLNVVEWKMNESMSGGAAKNRIEATEKLLYGQNQTGSLSGRLENLLKLASYEDGNVPVQDVTLPKDSVLKITFTSELSTKMSRQGDTVHFKAADNLYVNDVLVLPKGATGVGEVKKVVQPGIFGKDGRIDINFTYIYGIGRTSATRILKEANVNPDTRVRDLTDDEVKRLSEVINETQVVEGDLRREVALNIKRLQEIGCYRGIRHRRGLPVRGQKTKTNARTRKGPKKTVANKKK